MLAVFMLLWSGCDKGLEPLNEPSGFSGVIRFKNWPPPDSALELRIAAFETYPSDTSSIVRALFAVKPWCILRLAQPVSRSSSIPSSTCSRTKAQS